MAVSILIWAVRTKMGVFWDPPPGLTPFDGVWTGFERVFRVHEVKTGSNGFFDDFWPSGMRF